MRKPIAGGLGLLALAAVGIAGAAPPGTIYFSPEPVELSGNYEAKLKANHVKTLPRHDGEWKVFLVAWLRKAPGGGGVHILFFDKAEKKQDDPHGVMPVSMPAGSKILATSLSFNEDAGLRPDHTYDVVVARKVGGKDEIYAKAQLTLK
jgi:hypothetical protein